MSDGCPGSSGFLVLCPRLGHSLLPLPVGPSWRDGRKRCTPWSRCRGLLWAPAVEMCHLCLLHRAVLGSGCSPLPKQSLPFRQTASQAETCHPGCTLFHLPGHMPAAVLGTPGPGGMPCRAIFQHGKKKKKELDLLHAPFSQPKCLKV